MVGQHLAEPVQALAVGKVQVEQNQLDVGVFGVQAQRVGKRRRLDPGDATEFGRAEQRFHAEPDQVMVFDQHHLVLHLRPGWGTALHHVALPLF